MYRRFSRNVELARIREYWIACDPQLMGPQDGYRVRCAPAPPIYSKAEASSAAAMDRKPCTRSAQPSKNPVAAVYDTVRDEGILQMRKVKRKREGGGGMDGTGKDDNLEEEEKKKKKKKGVVKEKTGGEKLKKGKGGGILTNKLFSELTAKAIREMNYTHLTEVMLLATV